MDEKNKKELRVVELRAVGDEEMIIEGYAVVFDSPMKAWYTELIDRNAFNGCDMKDVCLKYNHNDSFLLLARTRNNSLELIVDDRGLKIRAKLIDTQSNRDIYKSVQAGLLSKMSFAFTVSEESWDYDTDTRTVLKIDKLYDVSIVDIPAYEATEVFARSKEEFIELKELEKIKSQVALEKEKLKLKLCM